MHRLLDNRNVLGVLFLLPAATLLLVFLTYPLGLGTWLVLEVLGIDEPVEPQLIGLIASAIGMVFGSLAAPADQRAAIAARS